MVEKRAKEVEANGEGTAERRMLLAQGAALLVGLAVVVPVELTRLAAELSGPRGLAGWLSGWNIDTSLPFWLFLLLPFFWRSSSSSTVSEGAKVSSRSKDGRKSSASAGTDQPTSLSLKGWVVNLLADSPSSPRLPRPQAFWGTLLLAVCVGCVAWGASYAVAASRVGPQRQFRFGSLPPAFHDEYSYLFQAQTFLAGRVFFPSHPTCPRLFDQMHVLNEGKFASRYFPGVGAWLAPFVWLGHPYWAQWLAQALTAMLVFGVGRELSNNAVGLLAGTLLALAPGYALFSNLLLSHHPTLLGLSLFTYGFVRATRTKGWISASVAGTGLSFAMLCRPLTAFGYCLPFAGVVAWRLGRTAKELFQAAAENRRNANNVNKENKKEETTENKKKENKYGKNVSCKASSRSATSRLGSEKTQLFRDEWRVGLCLLFPVLLGLVVLGWYDRALTGRFWLTPYQLYTDLYTPCHVYGFNNVVRGRQHQGPRVLRHYDQWAQNLTFPLAVQNLRNRLLASWQWTLGAVPLVMATVVLCVGVRAVSALWWVLAAALVGVHAAYFPYWYDGIMHWHYVFETGMLWLLLFALTVEQVVRYWRKVQRPNMPVWLGLFIGSLVLGNWVEVPPLWTEPRVRAGIEELAFSRLKYQAFRELLQERVTRRPALVLVLPDPAVRHIDFVVNPPDLKADVLIGRLEPEAPDRPLKQQIEQARRCFPDRACYLFNAKDWTLRELGP